jgi:hypothetical protein
MEPMYYLDIKVWSLLFVSSVIQWINLPHLFSHGPDHSPSNSISSTALEQPWRLTIKGCLQAKNGRCESWSPVPPIILKCLLGQLNKTANDKILWRPKAKDCRDEIRFGRVMLDYLGSDQHLWLGNSASPSDAWSKLSLVTPIEDLQTCPRWCKIWCTVTIWIDRYADHEVSLVLPAPELGCGGQVTDIRVSERSITFPTMSHCPLLESEALGYSNIWNLVIRLRGTICQARTPQWTQRPNSVD